MTASLSWYLASSLLGWLTFPLVFRLFPALADRGYTTLSIQMPVLASDAKAEDYRPLFPEAGERIAAGLADLRARGLQKIAIVSHSMGARMVNDFFVHDLETRMKTSMTAYQPEVPIMAWVPVSISSGRLGSLENPQSRIPDRVEAGAGGGAGARARRETDDSRQSEQARTSNARRGRHQSLQGKERTVGNHLALPGPLAPLNRRAECGPSWV